MADKYDAEVDEILDTMQGYIDDDEIQLKVKLEAKAKLSALLRRVEVEARVDELTTFNLPQYDHSKCIDKRSCIGYQNAQSDFDNEKEIRLAELQALMPFSTQDRGW